MCSLFVDNIVDRFCCYKAHLLIDYKTLSTTMSACDISSDSSSDVSMQIPTIPFGVITEKELTSDEENDIGFASMPAKESLYEDSDSDSDSDNYNDSVNNNSVDAAIDLNLHKKPRAIDVETSDNNRTKGPSKRQSQVSIFEHVQPKKKHHARETTSTLMSQSAILLMQIVRITMVNILLLLKLIH